MPTVSFEVEQHTAEQTTPEEDSLLRTAIDNYLAAPGSFYYDLLQKNFDKIKGALGVAKDKFGAPFRGMGASDPELGIQKIRPGHILRTTTTSPETPANTWSFTFTSGGDYYVGWSTNNTTAVNIDKEALLLILGVMFTQGSQPVVEELLIQVGNTTYPVQVIRDSWSADNKFGVRGVPIRPILLVPKATTLWQPYSIAGGVNELVLLGVTFGLGRFLRAASYSTVSL